MRAGGPDVRADDEQHDSPLLHTNDCGGVGIRGSADKASAGEQLLPLHPTLSFVFHAENSNTPITGIAPLPRSHYACISAASGEVRM